MSEPDCTLVNVQSALCRIGMFIDRFSHDILYLFSN